MLLLPPTSTLLPYTTLFRSLITMSSIYLRVELNPLTLRSSVTQALLSYLVPPLPMLTELTAVQAPLPINSYGQLQPVSSLVRLMSPEELHPISMSVRSVVLNSARPWLLSPLLQIH